ncbi:hypothetical protein AGMMS49944_02820 [Spirochaetia bacterium]|nr:hypothetical protein AGMMS49944_02820 [Spirochaetia bacterium]
MGDYDRAIADYTAALNINPYDALAKVSLDLAQRERGYGAFLVQRNYWGNQGYFNPY